VKKSPRAAMALNFLTDGLRPEGWINSLAWTSPFDATKKDRNLYLTLKTAQGLALSASPDAREALRKFDVQLRALWTGVEVGKPSEQGWHKDLTSRDIEDLQRTITRCLAVWKELQ